MDRVILILWPSWTRHDLWCWMMIVAGLAAIAHGLFSTNVRMRDNSSPYGIWRGKIVSKRWQVLYMRTFFVLIGAAAIICALDASFPG
jgi:hypothetical protein